MLILHCHLPYVRHPEHEEFLEENWLFEAVTETYLPVIEAFNRLAAKGVDFKVTVSLSPTLCEMLSDELLQKRCARYVEKRVQLCEKEVKRLGGTEFEHAARLYYNRFQHLQKNYGKDACSAVPAGLKQLSGSGHVELITSAATHAILPLCQNSLSASAQIEQGCRCFEKHFGRRPEGLWMPECAYSEEISPLLRNAGIRYSFLESHGALLADPPPAAGVFAPISTPEGIAMFARDPCSSKQVWSSDEGYPGDPVYREFYRDAGFDAPYEYIRPFLNPHGKRHQLGLKYHRITGDTPEKLPYDPVAAQDRARTHAHHFNRQLKKQVEELSGYMETDPVIVSPYDAELFGHWWLEGPLFLETVLEQMHATGSPVRAGSPSDCLSKTTNLQQSSPSTSTWGYEGHYDIWVSEDNDWIHRHLYVAEREMGHIAARYGNAGGITGRAVRQCIRELMLAQSSDWPFLINVGSATQYARQRINTHLGNFLRLSAQLRSDEVNVVELAEMERRHNIFSDINADIAAGP